LSLIIASFVSTISSEGNSGNRVPVAGIFLSKSFSGWLLDVTLVDVDCGMLVTSVLFVVDNEFMELDWIDVFIR